MIRSIALIFLLIGNQALAKECPLSIDHESVKVQWMAFKTSLKTPVPGFLKNIRVTPKTAYTLKELLHELTFEIDTAAKGGVETGDAGRDFTLADKFFKHLPGQGKIKGVVTKVDVQPHKNFATVRLDLGALSNPVPLSLLIEEKKEKITIDATGTIDLIEFGLRGAYDVLRGPGGCSVLHTGKDGISKTWTQVDLKVSATVVRKCES